MPTKLLHTSRDSDPPIRSIRPQLRLEQIDQHRRLSWTHVALASNLVGKRDDTFDHERTASHSLVLQILAIVSILPPVLHMYVEHVPFHTSFN